jgi:hypothetical protein
MFVEAKHPNVGEETMDISSRRRFLTTASVFTAGTSIVNALLGRTVLAADDTEAPKPGATWSVSGTIAEACSCDVMCPCTFASDPSAGYCDALIGWHVDSGKLGDVALDGLNVVLSFYSPGNVTKGNWKIGLYVDQRASPQQREALTAIFSGKVGGPLAVFAGPLVGERLGVKAVPIEYESSGKRRKMTIPGLSEYEIVAVEGRGGSDVTINNLPVSQHTSNARVVAKSTALKYNDHGVNWALSGKNGFYSTFAYSA